jgi:tRNA (cmo5U34)-methyltransferase
MRKSDNSTPHAAEDYDCGVLRTIPFYRNFHTEAIDLVRTVRPDVEIWLDTGCGTGYLAELAIPLFPYTRFILSDPAQAMLERARARLAGAPPGIVTFLAPLPSEKLPSAVSETPQVISAIQCHHYGDQNARRMATQACYRLLGPGGLYITFENIKSATQQGTEFGLERWLRFQLEAGRSATAVEEHRRRFDRDYFPITAAEHLELLRDTGFKTVEILWLSHLQAGFYAIK